MSICIFCDCVHSCREPRAWLPNKSNKMGLGHKEFKLLVICKLITGSLSRVNISEGYDKYIGSLGWKKPPYPLILPLFFQTLKFVVCSAFGAIICVRVHVCLCVYASVSFLVRVITIERSRLFPTLLALHPPPGQRLLTWTSPLCWSRWGRSTRLPAPRPSSSPPKESGLTQDFFSKIYSKEKENWPQRSPKKSGLLGQPLQTLGIRMPGWILIS